MAKIRIKGLKFKLLNALKRKPEANILNSIRWQIINLILLSVNSFQSGIANLVW